MVNKYDRQLLQLTEAPKLPGSFLAGGALTSVFSGKPIRDYDLYFKSKDAFKAAAHACYESMWCACATGRAVTFLRRSEPSVQLMLFDWFDSAGAIFDSFDFTCCMAAYDVDNKEFTLHDDFMPALAERRLAFNPGTRFPIASQLRVLKYAEKGYSIGRQDVLKLALACTSVQMNGWDDLRHQLGGVYGNQIKIAETGAFSIKAACDAIGSAEFVERDPSESAPGTAKELLAQIFGDKEEAAAPAEELSF